MAKAVRSQKLDSLARCLERLVAKTPEHVRELREDVDRQDIIMLNLERLVQLSVDLGSRLIAEQSWHPMPHNMASVFDVLRQHKVISAKLCLRMQKAVGFRNLAVHEYDKINWEIVYKILTLHLDDFRHYAQKLERIP